MSAYFETTSEIDLRQRFRLAREAKGWTQSDLADHLEVHWVTISKIERGVIGLTRDWIARLSEALNVSVQLSFNGGEGADIIRLVSTAEGKAIRAAREKLGWSQAKLAKLSGTYQQQVDRVERGTVAHSRVVPAIKSALGIGYSEQNDDLASVESVRSGGQNHDGRGRPNLSDLRISGSSDVIEALEEITSLLHAIQQLTARHGGHESSAISAVALAAKSTAEVALRTLRFEEAGK